MTAEGDEFMDADTAIFYAVEDGKKEAYSEIRAMLAEPSTDDPADLLREIAAFVGVEDNYDYFDDRGEWVLYPDHNN